MEVGQPRDSPAAGREGKLPCAGKCGAEIMEQRDIKHEVQALWLQYSGLRSEAAVMGLAGIENAAHSAGTQVLAAELPKTCGLMVAA